MCGIVGYTGSRPCQEILLAGLERLEYRGYDSAGLSMIENGGVASVRAVGNLSALRERVNGAQNGAVSGIGHTRWATHGRVTEHNCHPHDDSSGRVHVVLNGIVENWTDLKERLTEGGATFTSDTDAEVVAHLVASHYDGDLVEAVRRAYNELRGHYAFVALCADEPHVLVGARKECPLVVGLGDEETFIASAIPAFMAATRRVQLVENDEIVAVTPQGTRFLNAEGEVVERAVQEIDWDEETAEKGGYDTFMLKEIHQQPDAVSQTVADRLAHGTVEFGDIGIDDGELKGLRRIVVIACGTSYHAGLLGRYAIEAWSRVPVEMDVASEFRYRNPVLDERDLVIGISQSGETADTLAAMRLARERGAKVLAITNVMGSQATRDSDGVIFTRAGPEIGVAATKTFVAQLAAMYLFALRLAELRGSLEDDVFARLVTELKEMPQRIEELLASVDRPARAMAEQWREAPFFLYLGRLAGLAVALEGALKLKEIAYANTDAYAAGEMKHGPIALLDERTPVVCVATDSPVLDKVLSNVEEVRARGAHVLAVATEGNEVVARHVEEVLYVPRTDWLLQPLLAVIPLQLLAYHIARARGLNVDQPRNLAKTVTVE
ncbi:MAG: glutamine--fructose-6-phosphate transaminase (isomerizing) [Actinomycetota bacterium]|nr:glutamine--fructose-6-phosphate transaminase (isomerizing) [Actinomycetota bacterium]